MFQTEVCIETLSKNATARWKRKSILTADPCLSTKESKRLDSFLISHQPENFLRLRTYSLAHSHKISHNEDLPEITGELINLRKQHDRKRGSNFFQELNLKRLQKNLENFKVQEIKALHRQENLKLEIERLESAVQEICKKQAEALETRKVYNHIIQRMKFHNLKQEKTEFEYKTFSKQSDLALSEISQHKMRQSELKEQTKQAFNILQDYIETQTDQKLKDLRMVESEMKHKAINNSKREERFKRHIDIAERAANEERENKATHMREDVMLMRFYYIKMGKILNYEIKKQAHIEQAFEKVKKTLNINQTNEMIVKCLSSEIVFNDLKRTARELISNISLAQDKISEAEEKIKKIEKNRMQIVSIDALSREINEKKKNTIDSQRRLIRVKGVYNKIIDWTSKVLVKLGKNNPPKRLKERMCLIKSLIKSTINEPSSQSCTKIKLKSIIDKIEYKNLIKIRTDSEKNLSHAEYIFRELKYDSPSPELKSKNND